MVVDSFDAEQNLLITRSYAEAPEIDGVILVQHPGHKIEIGSYLDVEITDAHDHDLIATVSEEHLA